MSSTSKVRANADDVDKLHEIVDGIIGLRYKDSPASDCSTKGNKYVNQQENTTKVDEDSIATEINHTSTTPTRALYSDNNKSSAKKRTNLRTPDCNNNKRDDVDNDDNYVNRSKTRHRVKITESNTDNKEFENTPLTRWRRSQSANRVNTPSLSPNAASLHAGNDVNNLQDWMSAMKMQLQILTTTPSTTSWQTRASTSRSVHVNVVTESNAITRLMQNALIQGETGQRAMRESEEAKERLRLCLLFIAKCNSIRQIHELRERAEHSVSSTNKLMHINANTVSAAHKPFAKSSSDAITNSNLNIAKADSHTSKDENTFSSPSKKEKNAYVHSNEHAVLTLLTSERRQRWTLTSHEAEDYYKMINKFDVALKKTLCEQKLKLYCKLPL